MAKSLDHLNPSLAGVRGIVVNRVSKSLLGGLYTTHHFYAIVPFARPVAGVAGAEIVGAEWSHTQHKRLLEEHETISLDLKIDVF